MPLGFILSFGDDVGGKLHVSSLCVPNFFFVRAPSTRTDVYLSSNQIDRAPFIWTMSSSNHERRKDPNRIYSSSLSLSLSSLGRCNYHSLMAIMSYCHKIYEVVFRPQVGHFQQVNLPPNDPAVNNQARNLVNRWVKLHLSKSLERLCPPSLGHTVKQLISSKNQYASRTNDHNG